MSNSSDSDTMLHHLIPDPTTRERLLKTPNLEFLASLYDYEAHVLEHMFANGMRPEDLLLQLLKREPDPQRLIVQLDLKDAQAQQTDQAPRTASASETQHLARLQAMVPDAAQRERLLEIENLAFLAAVYEIKQQDLESLRAAGMTPVDVLLEVLKRESDHRRLIVLLNLREEEEKKQAKSAAEKPKNTTSSTGADGQKAKHAVTSRKPVTSFDEVMDETLMILKNKVAQIPEQLRKFFQK